MRRKQIIKNVGSIIEKLPQHQINIKESSDYGISLEFEVRIKKLGGKPIDLKTFTCAKRLFISDVYGNRPRGHEYTQMKQFCHEKTQRIGTTKEKTDEKSTSYIYVKPYERYRKIVSGNKTTIMEKVGLDNLFLDNVPNNGDKLKFATSMEAIHNKPGRKVLADLKTREYHKLTRVRTRSTVRRWNHDIVFTVVETYIKHKKPIVSYEIELEFRLPLPTHVEEVMSSVRDMMFVLRNSDKMTHPLEIIPLFN